MKAGELWAAQQRAGGGGGAPLGSRNQALVCSMHTGQHDTAMHDQKKVSYYVYVNL